MSRIPGPTQHDIFSGLLPARTPSPLGHRDAAAPNTPAQLGDTPGSVGSKDGAARLANPALAEALKFLSRYRENRDHLVEDGQLESSTVKGTGLSATVWQVGGAIIYRLTTIREDMDGSPRAYHPPTDESWLGKGPNHGRDSLLNAVGKPDPKLYRQGEKAFPLTEGCQLLRDVIKARELNASRDPKATEHLTKILKDHGVDSLTKLEEKSKSAVCVKYIDGRPKEDSRKDWRHVKKWAGIQVDETGNPKIRETGPNKGFYIPRISPEWADADVHPWVVLNPHLAKSAGLNLGNDAVVVANGEGPKVAFGLILDAGPPQGLGECSSAMIRDLGVSENGDYIYIQFPEAGDTKQKSADAMRKKARERFEGWCVNGRRGLEVVKDLFPTRTQYDRMLRIYLRECVHFPGDFPGMDRSRPRT